MNHPPIGGPRGSPLACSVIYSCAVPGRCRVGAGIRDYNWPSIPTLPPSAARCSVIYSDKKMKGTGSGSYIVTSLSGELDAPRLAGRVPGARVCKKLEKCWNTGTLHGSDWLKLRNESRATMGEPRTHVDSKRQPIESIIIGISNFFTGKKAVASVSWWRRGRTIFTHSLCRGTRCLDGWRLCCAASS
ncbi:hypothetical protein J6590_027749 [Homalodisca vitripennis]|nr:hypothetical protein J6590_027749 [Homalodisca vitripennis]